MESYINMLVDYRQAPFESQITVACPEEYLKSQMKHLTRSFKRTEDVKLLEQGDVAVLELESSLLKFNRPSVFVTVGGGLFHKEFEEQLVGRPVGDPFEVTVEGQPVKVTVKKATRTIFPSPTDEMAAAYAREHEEFADCTTVEAYRRQIRDQYLEEQKREAFYGAMEAIVEYVLTHSDWEFDSRELETVKEEFKEEIQQELAEEHKEWEQLSEEEYKRYFGVESKEELEQMLEVEAERRIATALWLASIHGTDARETSLEEPDQWGWEFLEQYIQENLKIQEEN